MKRFVYFAKDVKGGIAQLFTLYADKRPPPDVLEKFRQRLMAETGTPHIPQPDLYTVQELHEIPKEERQEKPRSILYVPGGNGHRL